MIMLLDKIVVSDIAPANTGVVWIKPVGDNYEQYIFLNGKWVKLDKAEEIPGIVSSVNNQTPDSNGNVNITKENIGLGNVDNTADTEKVVKGASEDGSGNVITTTYETKIDATTKQTALQQAISAIQTTVNNLVGLEGTNFAGFSVDTTEADALAAIPTKYTTDGYTNELVWYLVGDGIDNLKAYHYNGTNTPVLISNKVYDFTDFSGIAADVSTLRQDLDALGPKIDEIDEQINGTEGRALVQPTSEDYIHGSISASNTFQPNNPYYHLLVDVTQLRGYDFSATSIYASFKYLFVSSVTTNPSTGTTKYNAANGCSLVTGNPTNVTVPDDAQYIYLLCSKDSTVSDPPVISSTWEQAGGEGIAQKIPTIESNVQTLQGSVGALQGNMTSVQGSVTSLNETVGGKSDVSMSLGLSTGYFYKRTNDVFTLESHNTSKYTATPINLSNYIGLTLEVTLTNFSSTSSSRVSGIGDVDGNVIAYIAENQGSLTRIIEEGDYLYISCTRGCTPSAVVKDYATGMVKDILELQASEERLERIPDVKTVGLSFSGLTSNINVDDSRAYPACGFTHSLSTRIYGSTAGRLIITLPSVEFETGSMGVLIPWETQKVARLFFYWGDDADYVAHTSYMGISATQGELYYIQGKTFTRFNFPQRTKLQIRVEINLEASSTNWEFYVTNKAILNDHLPIAPICIMYDGGSWSGSVVENGVTMSLWQLHHKYNIPYGIGFVPGGTITNEEVAADLESGFAEYVYRSADVVDYYSGTDAQIVAALQNGWNSLDVNSRMLVLPQHKLDKKLMRCYMKAGAEIVRTGPCNSSLGALSSKRGDARLFAMPSARLGGTGGTQKILPFPNIIWEHGVGIPPQDYSGDMYVDTTGVNTPQFFAKLYAAMQAGEVVCMRPSEWVGYCLAH